MVRLEGKPVAREAIVVEMGKEVFGPLAVRYLHSSMDQSLDLLIQRCCRLGETHFSIPEKSDPPGCAVPMRGVGGVVRNNYYLKISSSQVKISHYGLLTAQACRAMLFLELAYMLD